MGIGLPDQVVTNHDLAQRLETSDDWITARTGIKTRRILEDDKALSYLGEKAGREALTASEISPEAIDLVIVATVTPDTFMPATACRVAQALECHNAGAFDLNIACSGFLYGLLTAVTQLQTGQARHVLLIGGDTISRILNWDDRRTAVLFGDSAGAVVLSAEGGGQLLGFDFGADGNSGEALQIKAGPSNPSDLADDYKVSMDGKSVFRFAANILVESGNKSLQKAGLTIHDVDLVIPHQANTRIIEAAAKKWTCPLDRFFINLEKYGNTSAGSIPVALYEAYQAGRIRSGSRILLAGFGGGLSWGSVVLEWPSHS